MTCEIGIGALTMAEHAGLNLRRCEVLRQDIPHNIAPLKPPDKFVHGRPDAPARIMQNAWNCGSYWSTGACDYRPVHSHCDLVRNSYSSIARAACPLTLESELNLAADHSPRTLSGREFFESLS